jgi:hypothetical protein
LAQKDRIVIKIADFVFAILVNRTSNTVHIEKALHDFLCSGDPHIIIEGYYDGLPDIHLTDKKRIFDSETIWSLYHLNGKNVFALKSPTFGPRPYRIAVFDSGFRKGKVYNNKPESKKSTEDLLDNPLEYPLSEVLMICLLSQGTGLLVHACGIDDSGRGYLFAGNSTHGKTTMAHLWKSSAIVLNDDRIVLRFKDGRFWMYGTPWHGEYTGLSANGVPVEKIFYLCHSVVNGVERLKDINAASMLLTRCFPPLWDEQGMKFTLDFCEKVVKLVSCYKLNFVPDENVVEFVRCVK